MFSCSHLRCVNKSTKKSFFYKERDIIPASSLQNWEMLPLEQNKGAFQRRKMGLSSTREIPAQVLILVFMQIKEADLLSSVW